MCGPQERQPKLINHNNVFISNTTLNISPRFEIRAKLVQSNSHDNNYEEDIIKEAIVCIICCSLSHSQYTIFIHYSMNTLLRLIQNNEYV